MVIRPRVTIFFEALGRKAASGRFDGGRFSVPAL